MTSKHLLTISLIILLSVLSLQMRSQHKSMEVHQQFNKIKTGLKTGDKEAFRDLISLSRNTDTILDYLGYHRMENTVCNIAWRTFGEYFIFGTQEQETEFDSIKTNHEKSDLILKHVEEIQFWDNAQAFVWGHPERRTLSYRLVQTTEKENDFKPALLNAQISDLKNSIKYGYYDDALNTIDDIAALKLPEAESFIHQCFRDSFFILYPFPDKRAVYSTAIYALRYYPSTQNIHLILNMANVFLISEQAAINTLEAMTVIPFSERTAYTAKPIEEAQKYLQQLKTLENMRLYGYEKRLGVKLKDSANKTDYYGQAFIASDNADDDIGYNAALADLVNSKDPLCLKYIASMIYRHRSKWDDYHFDNEKLEKLMLELTHIRLEMPDDKGIFSSVHTSDMLLLNYFIYWQQHYNDYAWNEEVKHFINTTDSVYSADPISIYFHQLGSEIDSVAINAYLQLIECDPVKVKEKLTAERELLSTNHYGTLPTFANRRLIAHAALYNYCKQQNLPFKPDLQLKKLLDSLLTGNEAFLYKLENRIIQNTTLSQLTAIEYWASTDGGEPAPYQMGRILDKLYTRFMDSIVHDETQLCLFLKKAYWYDKFGIIGTCNKYLWKLSNYDSTVTIKLERLKQILNDEDIISAINAFLKKDYWVSNCAGNTPLLYEDIIDVPATLARLKHSDFEARTTAYFNLQFNEYATDFIVKQGLSKKELAPVIKDLHKYAKEHKEEEFEFTNASAYAAWLKYSQYSLNAQFKKAATIKEKDIQTEVMNKIIIECNYKDIPLLINTYRNDSNLWFIKNHIHEDLAIPADLDSRSETNKLLNRYNTLSEKEVYIAYMADFGLTSLYLENGTLNYNQMYDLLEYDVVDAFVGGGGGRRATTATMAIRLLELEFNTLLGFHWRKEYIREGFVHSIHERSCAWMKFLREKNLVKLNSNRVGSFSN